MAETKHTPGPWRVHFNARAAALPGHIIETDDDVRHPVALLWVGGGTKGKPRQIANAHLIAAAPTMLEALKEAARHIDSARVLAVAAGHAKSEETFTQAVAALDLVIAKAEGRS